MNQQLEITLIDKIRETYAASIAHANQAKTSAGEAINKAVECGQYLIEAKTAVGHGRWYEWLANPNHGFDLTSETARKYMSLAAFVNRGGSLEDVQGMRQAYIAAGILTEPHREQGAHSQGERSQSWLSWTMKLTEEFQRLSDHGGIASIEEGERATMKEKLRPIVEIYERL